MKILAKRIYKFLDKYANTVPEPDDKDVTEYTSPDAYELLTCAKQLEQGHKPDRCFSEWGSGGYSPYVSKDGRKEHDEIVAELYKIINN